MVADENKKCISAQSRVIAAFHKHGNTLIRTHFGL